MSKCLKWTNELADYPSKGLNELMNYLTSQLNVSDELMN